MKERVRKSFRNRITSDEVRRFKILFNGFHDGGSINLPQSIKGKVHMSSCWIPIFGRRAEEWSSYSKEFGSIPGNFEESIFRFRWWIIDWGLGVASEFGRIIWMAIARIECGNDGRSSYKICHKQRAAACGIPRFFLFKISSFTINGGHQINMRPSNMN